MVQAIEPGSYARPWSEEAAKEDPSLRPTTWVFVGDKRLPYWMDETTARQARMVRDVTGHSRAYWLRDISITAGQEVDSFAVLWWLTRMQCGEPNLTFDEVEGALKVGDDFGISDYPSREAEAAVLAGDEPEPDQGEEDESPEA